MPWASAEDAGLPQLTYYLPSAEHRTGQSVLVLPGGGYGMVSAPKEGHRPAQFLAVHGIASAVLEYRHAPQRFPVPLLDAQRALRLLRRQARVHALDPARAGAMGFSAGGHLTGLLATQDGHPDGVVGDDADALSPRPDFAALVYPVVSLIESWSHFGSRDNLLGPKVNPELARSLSLEQAISAATPPCLIIHGLGDDLVPVENALALLRGLKASGVAAELHVYADLPHGCGLAANHPWGQALLRWLAKH